MWTRDCANGITYENPAKMHRHNNAASQNLTHYGRILLRMEVRSGKAIIKKISPRTSAQELQTGLAFASSQN